VSICGCRLKERPEEVFISLEPREEEKKMTALLQDLRFGLRMLLKSPGFSLVTILTLALGVGANAAIFSLTYAVILKSLPVPNPGELVRYTFSESGVQDLSISGPAYEALRKHETVNQDILAWSDADLAVQENGAVSRARGGLITGNGFRVLELRPYLGRAFGDSDDVTAGGPNGYQAMLGYDYWLDHFQQNPNAVGRVLTINGRSMTVIGVLPRGFDGVIAGQRTDIVLPLAFEEVINAPKPRRHQAGSFWLTVMGRLKPGETLKSAAANLRATDAVVREEGDPSHLFLSGFFAPFKFGVESGRSGRSFLKVAYTRPLLVLETLVGLLLLLCCANTALLVLARVSSRTREFALRSALGAPRKSLFLQILIEVGLLAGCGLAAGIWFGWAAARSLVSMLGAVGERPSLDVTPRWEIIAFAAGITVISALAAALWPALRASSADPLLDLRRGESTTAPKGFGVWIVPAQVAVSITLLSAASLLGTTFLHLQLMHSGFRTGGVVFADLDLRGATSSPKQAAQDVRQIVDALQNSPGIQSATVLSMPPLANGWSAGHYFSVSKGGAVHTDMQTWGESISPGYFDTLGTQILRGRALTRADGKSQVCVLSASAASYFFPGEDPVGKFVYSGGDNSSKDAQGPDPKDAWRVVGIAEDARFQSLREAPPRMLYSLGPDEDEGMRILSLAARGPSARMSAAAVRETVHRILPAAVPPTIHTFDDLVKTHLRQERMLTSLSVCFAGMGLLLTALGLYGVLSRSVLLRTREIGLRLALGAAPRAAMKLVVTQASRLVLTGAVVGVAAALIGGRMLRSLLFGVEAADPLMILAAVATLLLVAIAAACVPARRATRVDPMVALRYE
jgi:predicted permease